MVLFLSLVLIACFVWRAYLNSSLMKELNKTILRIYLTHNSKSIKLSSHYEAIMQYLHLCVQSNTLFYLPWEIYCASELFSMFCIILYKHIPSTSKSICLGYPFWLTLIGHMLLYHLLSIDSFFKLTLRDLFFNVMLYFTSTYFLLLWKVSVLINVDRS